MSKRSLDPDELRVTSFAASGEEMESLARPTVTVPTEAPDTRMQCPTATGCTCVETCFGGVC